MDHYEQAVVLCRVVVGRVVQPALHGEAVAGPLDRLGRPQSGVSVALMAVMSGGSVPLSGPAYSSGTVSKLEADHGTVAPSAVTSSGAAIGPNGLYGAE